MIGTNIVGVYKLGCYYPTRNETFRPSKKYPEYESSDVSVENNEVYDAVREAIKLLRFDEVHTGTDKWNPFGEFIKPNMTVLIKPNMVIDENKSGYGTECLYTHPSVVAPIIDYVLLALEGRGKIIIGDAPVQECDFQNLVNNSGYNKLIFYYKNKGVDIDLVDFRGIISSAKDGIYISKENEQSKGVLVNLGNSSEFSTLSEELKNRLRVTNYNPRDITCHHSGDNNEYLISEHVLNADVIINVPKPKTHRIAGMTASLKNFVGANVRKEYLPHHIMGEHKTGGDESDANGLILKVRSYCLDKKNICQGEKKYIRAQIFRLTVRALSFLMNSKSKNREGCWYGNNTISKTVTDINKIIYFSDKQGCMQNTPQRKVLIIADMIISGEGNGPLNPSPVNTGIIVIGTNPVYVDETIARMMGFDSAKIPTLKNVKRMVNKIYSLVDTNEEAIIYSNVEQYNKKLLTEITEGLFSFKPSLGWMSHIEL